jgi:hypothetical protein
MGEHAGIERTFRPTHVRFANLDPIASILAGIPGESRSLPLQLEPARLIGIAVKDGPLIDATITVGIPLQRIAVGR